MLPFFNVKAIDNSLAQEAELRGLIRILARNRFKITKKGMGKYRLDNDVVFQNDDPPDNFTDVFWGLFMSMSLESRIDVIMEWSKNVWPPFEREDLEGEFKKDGVHTWFKGQIFYGQTITADKVPLTISDDQAKAFNKKFGAEYLFKVG